MTLDPPAFLTVLAESGADSLEFENSSHGTYDIMLMSNSTGIGIASVGCAKAAPSAHAMLAMKSVTISGVAYRIRSQRWESFGESNYRFSLMPAKRKPARK
jgi:hypothetical protein